MAARSPRHRITDALPPAAGVLALATIAAGLYLQRIAGEPLGLPERAVRGQVGAAGGPVAGGLDRLLRGRGGGRAAPALAPRAAVRRRVVRPGARAVARAGGGQRRHRPVERRLRPHHVRGPERVPARPRRARLRRRVLPRPLRRARAVAPRARRRAPAGPAAHASCARDRLARRHGRAVHRRRRAQRTAHLPARAPGARRAACAGGDPVIRGGARRAALRSHLGGRRLSDARPARRVATHRPLVGGPGRRRGDPRGRVALRLVAAGGRRLGRDPHPAPRRPARCGGAQRRLRRGSARVPRPAARRYGLRPDRRAALDRGRLSRGHSFDPPLLVLAPGLARRVPRRPRRAAELARAARSHEGRGDSGGDLRSHRDSGRPRLHQGRDRADLAVPRAVRLPGGGAGSGAAAAVLAALAAQALLYEPAFDTVW